MDDSCPALAGDDRSLDDLLIEALASGTTQQAAAEIAGVSDRTVRRRMEEPDFRHRLHRRREDFVTSASGRLFDALDKATGTLVALLDSDSESMRHKAAISIIDRSTTAWHTDDVAARLRLIEDEARRTR